MKKQVLVSVDRGETRVALMESVTSSEPAPGAPKRRGGGGGGADPAPGYRVAELYFERRGNRSIVGNIYKGKVDNVLPGLEAAFVDIGLDKNGFLHVDEIVLPGVETVRRGRGDGSGKKITDLLKPGQEIVCQVVKGRVAIVACAAGTSASSTSSAPSAATRLRPPRAIPIPPPRAYEGSGPLTTLPPAAYPGGGPCCQSYVPGGAQHSSSLMPSGSKK